MNTVPSGASAKPRELGKVEALAGGLPGAHELHFGRLRASPHELDERKHAGEREPRIAGKQWRPSPLSRAPDFW